VIIFIRISLQELSLSNVVIVITIIAVLRISINEVTIVISIDYCKTEEESNGGISDNNSEKKEIVLPTVPSRIEHFRSVSSLTSIV
jgi:hypothetical protein